MECSSSSTSFSSLTIYAVYVFYMLRVTVALIFMGTLFEKNGVIYVLGDGNEIY